jgi:hypothetical protein
LFFRAFSKEVNKTTPHPSLLTYLRVKKKKKSDAHPLARSSKALQAPSGDSIPNVSKAIEVFGVKMAFTLSK